MFQKVNTLTNIAKSLVVKHGSEVGTVAKIAAHALIPGAPIVVSALESICDYAADKNQEMNDEQMSTMIESLGGDVKHLETLLSHLSGQLDGVVSQMSQMAKFGTPPQALESMMNNMIDGQFSSLRDELRALTPELETVKRQQEDMLRKQNLQGDMLHQVQESIDAALAFNVPLASEGVVGEQVPLFYAAQGRFQNALLNGDLNGAREAVDAMKAISPNGNTARTSEMSLLAVMKNFEGAEQVARTIVGIGANQPRIQKARQSLTKLTQAGGPGASSSLSLSKPDHHYEAGSMIGDRGWTLAALLGRGGMGSVWRAKNSRGQEGAVKLMNTQLSTDPQFVSRFQAEIDALDRISHAAVVDVLDWGQDRLSNAWYFVMPFIEGSSLRAKISRGVLTEQEVRELTRAIASGLVACHSQGVIHRDIKPENIMLKNDGSPVLIDFGIAHQDGQSTGETQMATGGYAPPEQLSGKAVDHSADLYALGMTLAECLGPQAGEDEWSDLITSLTHFIPSRRGTAQSLLEQLSDDPKKYHVSVNGQTDGPLNVNEVVARVLAGADDLLLWWPEASGWMKWDSVEAIKAKISFSKVSTPPPLPIQATPPPPPDSSVPEGTAGEVSTYQIKGSEFKLNFIPAGEFWMGSADGGPEEDEDEMPRHQVRITRPFQMTQTPITQAQWIAIMGSNPSHHKGENLPVDSVSWFDCLRFCNALSQAEGLSPVYIIGSGDTPEVRIDLTQSGYRLPTEAEWEYAVKAGTDFTYAGSNQVDDVAWYENTTDCKGTQPVGTKSSNQWGLFDLSGNVWEWCNDHWNGSAYKKRTGLSTDPIEWVDTMSDRVYRGGSWDGTPDVCRVSCRGGYDADEPGDYIGFRVVR